MSRSLKEKEYVIFDVETTGLSPDRGDRVIEVAAVKVENGEVVDQFESLINPHRSIPFEATQVNGISDEMVAGAPEAKDVVEKFLKFISGSCLVGHNVKFDLKFMNSEISLSQSEDSSSGLELFAAEQVYSDEEAVSSLDNFEVLDSLKMARGLISNLPSYALAVVANHFDIQEEQIHRALSDVLITHKVFIELLNIAEARNLTQFSIVHNLFGAQKIKKPNKKEKLEKISSAITSQNSLNLLYSGAQNGVTLRKVTPQKIQNEGRFAMLVGFCHLRKEQRSFPIDRIVQLEIEA